MTAHRVPEVLTAEDHRHSRILIEGSGSCGIFESVIDEFSPCGKFFRVGKKRWMPAAHKGKVVAILGVERKRRESI